MAPRIPEIAASKARLFTSAFILRPVAGRTADRRGRRPLLIGGALHFAAVTAAHVFTTELTILIALRLLLGAAEAFFFVAGFAARADLAPPGRAGEALSFNSLSLYLGIAIGPLLGELLLDNGGFRLAWPSSRLGMAPGGTRARLAWDRHRSRLRTAGSSCTTAPT